MKRMRIRNSTLRLITSIRIETNGYWYEYNIYPHPRTTRYYAELPGLASGGRHAHAYEQSGPGSC